MSGATAKLELVTAEPKPTVAEREHPRYAHEVTVRFRFGPKTAPKSADGRTRNVSRGGLCANLAVAIPVGTDVDLELTLVFDDARQSEALILPARVVWCTTLDEQYQVGVSFRPMDPHRAQLVQMFLKFLGEERGPKQARVEKSIDDQFD